MFLPSACATLPHSFSAHFAALLLPSINSFSCTSPVHQLSVPALCTPATASSVHASFALPLASAWPARATLLLILPRLAVPARCSSLACLCSRFYLTAPAPAPASALPLPLPQPLLLPLLLPLSLSLLLPRLPLLMPYLPLLLPLPLLLLLPLLLPRLASCPCTFPWPYLFAFAHYHTLLQLRSCLALALSSLSLLPPTSLQHPFPGSGFYYWKIAQTRTDIRARGRAGAEEWRHTAQFKAYTPCGPTRRMRDIGNSQRRRKKVNKVSNKQKFQIAPTGHAQPANVTVIVCVYVECIYVCVYLYLCICISYLA